MARWNDLTKEQREAVLAFTREAPNGKPNGPEEAAWEEIVAAVMALPESALKERICNACRRACLASADQIRALRLAFGLAEDGATPREG